MEFDEKERQLFSKVQSNKNDLLKKRRNLVTFFLFNATNKVRGRELKSLMADKVSELKKAEKWEDKQVTREE